MAASVSRGDCLRFFSELRGTSLLRTGKPSLSPCLKYRDRHGVGQVQAAIFRQHRQPHTLFCIELSEYFSRKAAAFRTEQKRVTCLIG